MQLPKLFLLSTDSKNSKKRCRRNAPEVHRQFIEKHYILRNTTDFSAFDRIKTANLQVTTKPLLLSKALGKLIIIANELPNIATAILR